MTIRKINSEPDSKWATVTLYYDEIRDIENGLYDLLKMDSNRSPEFYKLRRDMFLLFDLVKNGCIDSWAVKKMSDLTEKIAEREKQDG